MNREIEELQKKLEEAKAKENENENEIVELTELSDINFDNKKEVIEKFKFKVDDVIYSAKITVKEEDLISFAKLGEVFNKFQKKQSYENFINAGFFGEIKNFLEKNVIVTNENGEVEFEDASLQLHLFSACIKLITPRLSELQNK